MTTLKERLEVLSQGKPRGWQAELARQCKIAPPSVADWLSGKTRSIDGKYLTTVAEYFGVSPHWLSTGEGSRSRLSHQQDGNGGTQMVNVVTEQAYKPTGEATRLAMLLDMIPESDLIRRSQAYSAASTAIIAVIEGHKAPTSAPPIADQKTQPA